MRVLIRFEECKTYPYETSVGQNLRYLWKKEQKEPRQQNGKNSGDKSNDWLLFIDDNSMMAVLYIVKKVVVMLA